MTCRRNVTQAYLAQSRQWRCNALAQPTVLRSVPGRLPYRIEQGQPATHARQRCLLTHAVTHEQSNHH